MPVVRTDGRSLGEGSREYQFSWMGSIPHFLSYGAPPSRGASCRAWISAIKHVANIKQKSKADFKVGNILSFNQYFGRHGLPSSGSYIY